MARPRKDEFKKITIRFDKKTEHELVHVSVPFFLKIIYEEKISEDDNGKAVYGTDDIILKRSIFNKKMIIKEFEELHLKVIEIKRFTFPLPNICEKCHAKGTPRIEVQPNDFYYHYNETMDSKKNKSNRPDEYWLVYDHRPKKCRIAKFDISHLLLIPPKNRPSNLIKHFFPYYLEDLKKELTA